jgi:hypothetical protein
MTVREAITMSALLRLPKNVLTEEKMEQVDKMIKLLGLEKAANTIIGDAKNKGISGGERKRTAMAMEMITNPSVLFLDGERYCGSSILLVWFILMGLSLLSFIRAHVWIGYIYSLLSCQHTSELGINRKNRHCHRASAFF